eukprot:TRINITY_DN312_c0_g2_i1.p1 TRINITY_DN312_c0_g2~~TRINITY_DN312_c0_g2_i1.p1  ORF type:complete len:410 (+),score=84.23 TRINITY_DN312_c0_g2_i1:62-1291(+)
MPVLEFSDSEEDTVVKPELVLEKEDLDILRIRYKDNLDLLKFSNCHNHSTRNLHEKESELLAKIFNESISPGIQYVDVLNDTIDDNEFKNTFIRTNTPVMIKGICQKQNWSALEKWSSVDNFINHYGHIPFKVTEISSNSGGKPFIVRLPIGLYVEYVKENKADFPFYVFERDLSDIERKQLMNDYHVPSFFTDDLYSIDNQIREFFPKYKYMVIGGNRTGSNMHVDPKLTGAWNTLLSGRKKWILLPPNDDEKFKELIGINTFCDPEHGVRPPLYWWTDVYPNLKNVASSLQMIECIQEPGETIFVPSGWWHAVVNMDLTIAITQNVLLPETLRSVWSQLKSRYPKFAPQFYKSISAKRPELFDGLDVSDLAMDDDDYFAAQDNVEEQNQEKLYLYLLDGGMLLLIWT